uniref:Uncharacterized protein n=1 Tax=Solanum tuberosum TaxID=4113 RepID=M1DN48_SOLTU
MVCGKISGQDPRHLKTINCKVKVKSSGISEGSPKLTGISHDLNEMPIDDPEHLHLHHETLQAKWLTMWNLQACKGNSKA